MRIDSHAETRRYLTVPFLMWEFIESHIDGSVAVISCRDLQESEGPVGQVDKPFVRAYSYLVEISYVPLLREDACFLSPEAALVLIVPLAFGL